MNRSATEFPLQFYQRSIAQLPEGLSQKEQPFEQWGIIDCRTDRAPHDGTRTLLMAVDVTYSFGGMAGAFEVELRVTDSTHGALVSACGLSLDISQNAMALCQNYLTAQCFEDGIDFSLVLSTARLWKVKCNVSHLPL